MKTNCSRLSAVLALILIAAGCGDAPEDAPATPATPGKVARGSPDKAQLNTALLSAVQAKDAAKVEGLLVQGADARTKTRWGKPALHLACEKGNLAIVQTLLEKGGEINAQIPTKYSDDGIGYDGAMAGSPLTYAASAGHIDVLRLLLDRGSGADTPTLENRTPLMYAVAADVPTAGHADCVRLLIERGADVNTPVPRARGILSLAGSRSFLQNQTNELAAQQQIVEALKKAGARP